MNTPVERLIDAAENMTPDEIHQHPMAAFDKMRALTRELRLMRAGVVAEEPEWEYGVRNAASGKTGWPWTRDEALKQAGISPMFEAVQRIRTEWVPVKHERAGHEGDS